MAGRLKWLLRDKGVLLAIVALGALLRLYGLGAESLWFDEGWSARVAQMDWGELVGVLRSQPFPLYYLTLNLWSRLGQSEAMLRGLSALGGVVSIPLLYSLVHVCAGRRGAELAALLLAISPLHVWYSQEARMYALAAAFVLAASWAFLRAVEKGRWPWWAIYVLLSAAAVYTFYYAALACLAQAAFLFCLDWRERLLARGRTDSISDSPFSRPTLRGRLVSWFVAQVVILLLCLPGLKVLWSQLGSGTWLWVSAKYGPPSLRTLLETATAFSIGESWWGELNVPLRWALIAFALAFLAGIGKVYIARERVSWLIPLDPCAAFLISNLILPVGVLFVLSQLRPGFLVRYLVPFLPFYCAVLGKGLFALAEGPGNARTAPLWRRCLFCVILLAIIATSVLALAGIYRETQKEEWRALAQYIQAHQREEDMICLVDEDTSAVFSYYYRGTLPVVGVSGSLADEQQLAQIAENLLAGRRRLWLVLSHTTNRAFWGYLERLPELKLVQERRVVGIELALFERLR